MGAKLTPSGEGSSEALAKSLQTQIAKLTGTFDDASIGLSGGPYAVPPVKGATSFSRINGQASALLEMVASSSEQAPVTSLYRTYWDLCRDFNTTAAAWSALRPKVTQWDARLKHTGTPPPLRLTAIAPLTCDQ